jgi:AraC family transcriptional regulator
MLMNSFDQNLRSFANIDGISPPPTGLISSGMRPRLHARRLAPVELSSRSLNGHPASAGVEISPAATVRRSAVTSAGISAEIVESTSRERVEHRYRGPLHLLVIYERGARLAGETRVGAGRSGLRDLTRKLTFVPAGHDYHEWHEPRMPMRLIHIYLDPAQLPADLNPAGAQVLFEDAALWNSACKLASVIGDPAADDLKYLEALGVVLVHELRRVNQGPARSPVPLRGGLAAWQQRIAVAHIEEHLSDRIPLAALAQLARLSPYHFSRAFKQSFGVPPHRYHVMRRIEHAKELLAEPATSVTETGRALGFSDTSSFTATFRKVTGMTPTAYCRSLGESYDWRTDHDAFVRPRQVQPRTAPSVPALSPRGALAVALKQMWPGSFSIERQPHGFDITLSHGALPGRVTVSVEDALMSIPRIVAGYATQKAWTYFLAGEGRGETDDAEADPSRAQGGAAFEPVPLRGEPARLEQKPL